MGVSGFIPSLCFSLVPGFHRSGDLFRDLQRFIDLTVYGLRSAALSDSEKIAMGRGQDHRDDLVGAQLLPESPPRGMHPLVPEAFLDGDQKMIGQHAEKNMSLDPMLEVVENRPFHQRALGGSESRFDPPQ